MAMNRAFSVLASRALVQIPRSVARRNVPSHFVAGRRWMSNYFLQSHEYIKVEGEIGTVGITDFAQQALGDVVFVDLPEVGDTFEKGESFGSVESVKAASDVYAPVSGEVVEVNETLSSEPGLVNTSAMSDGWFIKLKLSDKHELKGLLNPAAYKAHCDAAKH